METAGRRGGGYYTSFTFSAPAPPPGSAIQSVILYVEHYEDPGFGAASLVWRVGTGWPSAPVAWDSTTAPVRYKSSAEGVDAWDVTAAVSSIERLQGMELCIQNSDGKKKTYADRIWAEVTYGITNNPPVAADDAAATDEDTAAAIDVLGNDSDPDGDPLSVESVGSPGHGSAASPEADSV